MPWTPCYDFIGFSIKSLKDFQDSGLAFKVISKINEYRKDFIPNVYDLYEPLKKKYDPNNISDIVGLWMNEENNRNNAQNSYAAGQVLMEKRGKHKVYYRIRWEKGNQTIFNSFSVSVDFMHIKDRNGFERFKNLCNELILLLEPVQGDISNRSFAEWAQAMNLRVRYPELTWMVLFGRPYIEMFGREKLLGTPCYKVECIGNNVIALQLTENIFDPIPPEARYAIKKYLGEDAFVEEGKDYRSYDTGRVPDFDFSTVLFDKTKLIVEPQVRTRGQAPKAI